MKIGIYCNIEKHMYIEVDAPNAEMAAELNRRGEYKKLWEKAASNANYVEQFCFSPQPNCAENKESLYEG